MNAFGKCKGGGRRSAPRIKAPLVATVTTVGNAQSAIVLDVSSTGVRLRGTDLPPQGKEVFVVVEGLHLFGEVAWAEDADRGVHFETPLSSKDEARIQAKVAEARGMPLELRLAFEDWAFGVAG